MVSMKDVSKHAGVSVATVSNVITGKRQVSETIRRRVLDSIAELDYQVNLVARGLKTQRTSTIGLILPDITKLFFQRVISGILSEVSKIGYRLNILNSGYDFENERMLINVLRGSRVDGIILDSCVSADAAAAWVEELTADEDNAPPVV
ncbi:MAG: LacI family DNA-binding transcriptional regulator, partial [Clostridia bacterium]|nr:LacI family DNA-binding transcriptional regulator [Clostridia bacterium]